MFTSSQDILNLSLAIGFGLIALFLSIALFYVIFILRDLGELTQTLKKTAKKANEVLVQPTKFLTFLFSKARVIAELVEKQIEKKMRAKK